MANSFVKYDKADWHHDAADGDVVAMHLHTGFFMAWLAEKNLLDPELQELAEPVLRREMTGQELFQSIDGKLSSDNLNDEGNVFAQACYPTHYFSDYEEFAGGRKKFYSVEDTWENYEKVSRLIDRRYAEWKAGKLQKPKWSLFTAIADRWDTILIVLLTLAGSVFIAWLLNSLSS